MLANPSNTSCWLLSSPSLVNYHRSFKNFCFTCRYYKLSFIANGALVIRWDDTNSQIPRVNKTDDDFDDFIVRVDDRQECLDK